MTRRPLESDTVCQAVSVVVAGIEIVSGIFAGWALLVTAAVTETPLFGVCTSEFASVGHGFVSVSNLLGPLVRE